MTTRGTGSVATASKGAASSADAAQGASDKARTMLMIALRMMSPLARSFTARCLASQVRNRAGHLIGGLDHFGIHFISALRLNEIADFGDRVDVRGFQVALLDHAESRIARHADCRRAGGGGLLIEIVAE